jgi:LysR family cys regulon transcriptional activator
VLEGEADFCVATEAIAQYPELVSMPVYQWNRCVVVPARHPLLKVKPLTLERLADYPIVTYDFAFANRSLVEKAFENRGLQANVVLTALDSDVIKTYVELGMGVGIVAQMAYDPVRDGALVRMDASHLFAPSTTRLGLRRGVFLRGYVYDLIARLAPSLDRQAVDAALARPARDPDVS